MARLEEIESERVEDAGGLDVIQYRGQILPLLHLRDVLEERRGPVRLENDTTAASSLLQLVVFGTDGCSVGLVVDEVLDIVEQGLEVKGRATRGGVSGTAVVQDRVTELFDVDGFLEQAIPLLMDAAEA